MVLEGQRLYGLHNTGSSITIPSESLAKVLGLPITPYEGTFRQAACHVGCFTGKLSTVKVQLHDGLELVVGGIKVMVTAHNKLQFMCGTDLFAPAGTKL